MDFSAGATGHPTIFENAGDVTVKDSSPGPLRMMKMPIKSKDGLELLNGLGRGEAHESINVRRIVIIVLFILGLGIVIPLFPDIKRYLRMQRM